MNRISLTISLVLLMCGYGYGQVGTMEMIPQSLSPNAAALGKYVEMPVSHYSGLPQIGIPLYELQAKDIKVPISLSYYASGIKVKEIPGWVGAGWSLNAGGLITRIVRGLPDDHFPAITQYPDPDLYAESFRSRMRNSYNFGFNVEFDEQERWRLCATAPGVVFEEAVQASVQPIDTEYDIYYFNFMGHTGRFTFTNEGEIIMLPASDLRVERLGKKFKITDANGIEYYFNDTETAQDKQSGFTPNRHYISSWYLSRVSIPHKNEQVYFTYQKYLEFQLYRGMTYYPAFVSSIYKIRMLDLTPAQVPRPHCQELMIGSAGHPQKTGDTLLFLKQIVHLSDTIKFYHDTTRADIFKCKLDSFKVFQGNSAIHSFKFKYGYSTGVGTDPAAKKLKLDSLQIDDQPSYKFAYYEKWMGKIWPHVNRKGVDTWGYYNGEDDPTDVNGNIILPRYKAYAYYPAPFYNSNSTYKNPDYKYGQLGSLKSITYPTSGKTEFEYEGNTFHSFQYQDSLEADPGTNLILDSTRVPRVFAYSDLNGSPRYTASKEFVIHNDQTVTLKSRIGLYSSHVNPMNLNDYMSYFYNYGDGGDAVVRLLKYNSVSNDYELVEEQSYNPVTLIGQPVNQYQWSALLSSYGIVNNTHTLFLQEGQYKLESEIGMNLLQAELEVSCKFPYKKYGPVYNSGGLRIRKIKFSSPVNSSSFEKNYDYRLDASHLSSGILESPFSNLGSSMYLGKPYFSDFLHSWVTQACMFLNVHDNPLIPLGNAQGGVIGYTKVTEKMNDGRKTVYNFSNSYGDPAAGDEYQEEDYNSFIARLRISRDNSAKRGLLEQVDYINAMGELEKREIHNYYTDPDFRKNSISMPINITQNVEYNWGLHPVYTLTWSDQILKLRDSVYYFKGADTLKEVTKYAYNLSKHIYPSKVTRINSFGDSTVTNYKYPQDYTISSASAIAFSEGIRNLQNRNVVSQPVETYVEKKDKGGGNARVVEAQLVSFTPNMPVPDTVYTLNNPAGLADFNPAGFTAGTASKDSRYKRRLLFNKYDNGNVVEQSKDRDVKEVLVWGYKRRYIVARAQGSSYNTVIAMVDTNVVNNPSSDVAMRTELNKIRTGLASGNPNAKVTTYTYAPLKGITSVTDPANRAVYYEYDNFGRLKMSKDQDSKVTDRIIYHYKP